MVSEMPKKKKSVALKRFTRSDGVVSSERGSDGGGKSDTGVT